MTRFLWLAYAAYILTIFVGNPWISLTAALVFSFALWQIYPRKAVMPLRPSMHPTSFVEVFDLDGELFHHSHPITIIEVSKDFTCVQLAYRIADALRTEQTGEVMVDLGEQAYSASYITYAFGSLVKKFDFTVEDLQKRLRIVCNYDQSVVSQAWLEIEEAGKN